MTGVDAIPMAHEKLEEWRDALECLKADSLPKSGKDRDFCKYRVAVAEFEAK